MCTASGCASSKYRICVSPLEASVGSLGLPCVHDRLGWKAQAGCIAVEEGPVLVRLGFPLEGKF